MAWTRASSPIIALEWRTCPQASPSSADKLHGEKRHRPAWFCPRILEPPSLLPSCQCVASPAGRHSCRSPTGLCTGLSIWSLGAKCMRARLQCMYVCAQVSRHAARASHGAPASAARHHTAPHALASVPHFPSPVPQPLALSFASLWALLAVWYGPCALALLAYARLVTHGLLVVVYSHWSPPAPIPGCNIVTPFHESVCGRGWQGSTNGRCKALAEGLPAQLFRQEARLPSRDMPGGLGRPGCARGLQGPSQGFGSTCD